MARPADVIPALFCMVFAMCACAGAAQPTANRLAPSACPAANAQAAAVSRSDAEVKKSRGPGKPLFQVRLIQEATGRTMRPAGEAALR